MKSNIPPINRLPGHLARLSSMRASTRVGMVYVGGAKQPVREDTFIPHVIEPDRRAQRERAAWRQAISQKNEQLRRLRDEAACDEEAAIWAQALGEAG